MFALLTRKLGLPVRLWLVNPDGTPKFTGKGQIPDLSRRERDLLLAWIDTNGLFHGTWDYTKAGCAIPSWAGTKAALAAEKDA